eukprot:2090240-Alexandrium_andersonii.AAC.1
MELLPRPGSSRRSSGAAAAAVRGRSTRASSWRGRRRCAGQRRSQFRPGCAARCAAGWRVRVCLAHVQA